ncbi:GGDEF domain-containing protein [Lysinibacillus sp. SGAir0095]|uniref:GGDEF domain-containing protein n=1 Tax=Lysinibacillus sp. SGAir0095 TaxID=2070463 RepID=UPI0010CD33EE|nr:diguanylate cyclase [Lysinibacillus sp. SGAir0095]QCR32052.1 GGDEF domain-containing protein [Lysinibacillus sp. SGAir0095]
MIIKDIISNLALLWSVIFLHTHFTSEIPITRSSPLSRRLLFGFLGGLFSNVLMQFSISIGNSIIDMRHIPIILIAFYGGAVPAVIGMVLVIFGRFLFGFNESSYAAAILIIVITLVSIFVFNTKLSKRTKLFIAVTVSNITFSILISYLLPDTKILVILIPSYWAISYLSAIVSIFLIRYIRNSQRLLNLYKVESSTDALTGLNNVRKFDTVFNELLKNVKAKDEKLSLLYIDIDFFKKVNDTYGHLEGDIVLKELGNILKNTTRSFDIVSRNGGEEFTVILLDCPLSRALELSERIRASVEDHSFFLSSQEKIAITVSIGVACYGETTQAASSLIEDADKAL